MDKMPDRCQSLADLVNQAYFHAQTAKDCILDPPENRDAAIAYTLACISNYTAAVPMYWSAPEFQHSSFSALISAFSVFTDEILEVYRANGSVAYITQSFNALKDPYQMYIAHLKHAAEVSSK